MIIVEQSWALTSDDWQWPGPDPDWCRVRAELASPPDTAAPPAQSVLRGRVEDTDDAQVQLTSTHQDEQVPIDEILDYMIKDELSIIYIQMGSHMGKICFCFQNMDSFSHLDNHIIFYTDGQLSSGRVRLSSMQADI